MLDNLTKAKCKFNAIGSYLNKKIQFKIMKQQLNSSSDEKNSC